MPNNNNYTSNNLNLKEVSKYYTPPNYTTPPNPYVEHKGSNKLNLLNPKNIQLIVYDIIALKNKAEENGNYEDASSIESILNTITSNPSSMNHIYLQKKDLINKAKDMYQDLEFKSPFWTMTRDEYFTGSGGGKSKKSNKKTKKQSKKAKKSRKSNRK